MLIKSEMIMYFEQNQNNYVWWSKIERIMVGDQKRNNYVLRLKAW